MVGLYDVGKKLILRRGTESQILCDVLLPPSRHHEPGDEETGLFAYAVPPMDFGWKTLPSIETYLKMVIDDTTEIGGLSSEISEATRFFDVADELGTRIGWEGDYKTYAHPRVIVLPNESSPKLAVMWKQNNNGTTFVVSQVELPWLD